MKLIDIHEAKYYQQKEIYYHVDGGFVVELISSDVNDIITIRDVDTGEEHVMSEEEFVSTYQKMGE